MTRNAKKGLFVEETLRPAEKVMKYLMAEFATADVEDGTRLPTVRDLSERLQVSAATVRNVFQRLAKEGKIRTEVGNGTFLVVPKSSAKAELIVGVNVAFHRQSPPLGLGYQRIYGGLMEGLLSSSRSITLRPLPVEIWERADVDEVPRELMNLDGIILFPLKFSARLRQQYRAMNRPAVNLNQPGSSETADYVSPDYFDAGYRLARCWMEAGRRRLAILASPPLEKSLAMRQRCAGFLAGVGEELGKTVTVRLFSCETSSGEAAKEAVAGIFRSEKFKADAIFGTTDQMGHGAMEALANLGASVPDDVSVVAGQGLVRDTGDGRVLTSMEQPFEALGSALAEMLLQKIDTGSNEPAPARMFPIRFAAGQTTTAEENRLLKPE